MFAVDGDLRRSRYGEIWWPSCRVAAAEMWFRSGVVLRDAGLVSSCGEQFLP